MDWASIVSTAIAGVVGLAGIGGTLLSARITGKSDAENLRTSIGADDQRARLGEKRRIYANCLGLLMLAAIARIGIGDDPPSPETASAATATAANAVSEVALVAPREVYKLAGTAMIYLLDGERELHADTIAKLTVAMRADLGEPE